MVEQTINPVKRRNEQHIDPELEQFVVALAHELPDSKWYDIEEVGLDEFNELYVSFEDANSIGNRYIEGLLARNYAYVGHSNHYTEDESVDRLSFERIDHDDDSFKTAEENPFANYDVETRLAEIDIRP